MTDEVERQRIDDDEIDLFELFGILWRRKWLIIGTSLGAGILALVITFFMSNIYRSEAVIKPVKPESKAAGLAQQLGGILPGIEIGGSGSIQDLEVLLTSKDLTVRVFEKYNLYPVVFKGQYDEKTGKYKGGGLFSCSKEPPGEWDAIREAKDLLRVRADVKRDVVRVSFDSKDPELSARVLGYYLEEAKSRLQEQALEKASRNKEFIEKQLEGAVDPLIKERLYNLFGREVEEEMMAKNREEFAFTILDPPKVPDRKVKPRRGLTAVIVTLLTAFIIILLTVVRDSRRKKT